MLLCCLSVPFHLIPLLDYFHFLHNLRVLLVRYFAAISWQDDSQYHDGSNKQASYKLILNALNHLQSEFLLKQRIKQNSIYINISQYQHQLIIFKSGAMIYILIYLINFKYKLLNFIDFYNNNIKLHMTVRISDWDFNLVNPVYLIHPNYKFWEAKVQGKTLHFRVGKLRDSVQSNIQQSNKPYSSNAVARQTIIAKIQQKLTKSYTPRDAKKVQPQKKEQMKQQKQVQKIKSGPKKSEKSSKVFSGQYYQKGKQAERLQVNDRRVKITKIDNGVQKYEIRSFQNYDKAVQFCLQQQSWLLSEGYKVNNSKFIYSFIDDNDDVGIKSGNNLRTKKKQQNAVNATNFLSITKMTDDAISHRSRNNSTAKSDRSAGDSDLDDNQYVPSKLGNPTSGPISVLLAETWDDSTDPQGWIMSEKLDGVRCFWTGTTMYSRNGNRFFFPKFFTKGWPKSQMDGQLFIGRGKFSQTISAIKKGTPINSEWEKVRYLVFDAPGLKLPFKDRLKTMEKVIKQVDSPYLKCHAHRVCQGFDDLWKQLDLVNKIQGEGLMLRDPESKYQNRRSKSLLKVKTFYDDEAQVIGHKPGTGRCTGMCGALQVRNTHGVQFEVGSGMTDAIRRRPPKIGSKITYKYQQFNKDSGKPRFPIYMRTYDKI